MHTEKVLPGSEGAERSSRALVWRPTQPDSEERIEVVAEPDTAEWRDRLPPVGKDADLATLSR
jgi:hypothetical protein